MLVVVVVVDDDDDDDLCSLFVVSLSHFVVCTRMHTHTQDAPRVDAAAAAAVTLTHIFPDRR